MSENHFLSIEELEMDLFEYRSYRSFLSDYFEACQKRHRRYSFRFFSKSLGLSSPGYIQAILQGKKEMSDRLSHQLVVQLGLSKPQSEYFELLVKMSRVEVTNPQYQSLFEQAQKMRTKKLKVTSVTEAQCTCISSWYHWVVREMLLLRGKGKKIQWFRRCLSRYVPLSGKQVLGILDDLKTAELLGGDEQDTLPDPVLNLEDDTMAAALKLYHKGAMEQGILSLANPSKDREYGAVLVATTPEKIQQVKETLRQTRREILQILDTPTGEATVLTSFSYQFFPVAKSEEDE